MEEHIEIILEALQDYQRWYLDQGGNAKELAEDRKKVIKIHKAIDFINSLKK